MTTLIYCLLILTISTLLVFTVSRSSLYEQQFLANEYWSSRGFYISDAAMHYVLAWLADNTPDWQVDNQQLKAILVIPSTPNQQLMADIFTSQVVFLSDPLTPDYIEIIIKTTAVDNNTIEFSHRMLVKRQKENGHYNITRVNGSWRDF